MEKENQRERKNTKRTKLTFGDLMIPMVSGVIFLLVLFFILIPSVNNSNEMLLEREKVKERQEVLSRNLEIIEGIDFVTLQTDLSNARRVLPRRLEVAQFAYYVDSLAKEKDLIFRELKAGNIEMVEERMSYLDVRGIRVPIVYSGEFEPITEFFDELQTISPYVISFGHKIELRKRGLEEESNVEWNLEISVTGYSVLEATEIRVAENPFARIKPYNSETEMVEEFAERVAKLID